MSFTEKSDRFFFNFGTESVFFQCIIVSLSHVLPLIIDVILLEKTLKCLRNKIKGKERRRKGKKRREKEKEGKFIEGKPLFFLLTHANSEEGG